MNRASRVRLVIRWLAIGVAGYSVVAALLILAAAIVDDVRIDQDMGSAIATVTEVTPTRAAIEFDTATGVHHRPETGVLYPTGLVVDQQVRVEYRRANPELVRVSGRSWTTAIWPLVSLPAIAVPICALVYAAATPGVHRRVRNLGQHVPRRSPRRDPAARQ